MRFLPINHYFLTFICLLVSLHLHAQSPSDLVEKFFDEYQKKGSSYALDELYKTNKWFARSADGIAKVKRQLEGLNEDFVGKYYGYEFIVRKDFANCYTLISCLGKYDRQPIRFTFQFYKPQESWTIYSFQYDDTFDDELEEAAKLYYLNLDR